MSTSSAEIRGLRRQVREWRSGRTDRTVMDVLSDAYIGIFAAVMFGAMGVNVVRHARTAATTACTTSSCADARHALPWVFALAVLVLVMLVARLVGPSMVSPADASWLLSAPVDRRALLRPRLLLGAVAAASAGLLLGAMAFGLGGFDTATPLVALVLAAACTAGLMVTALDQSRDTRWTRWIVRGLGFVAWALLLAVALPHSTVSGWDPPATAPLAVVAAVTVLLAGALTVRAVVRLPRVRGARLTAGGVLLTSLSGALAGLDLALTYDVLLARRWRERANVRPVRGGPSGTWALAWRDLVRIRRSPGIVVVLAASLVVPYVAAAMGLGETVTIVGAATGFVASVGAFAGLRILSRTPGLVRCLPMSPAAVCAAALAVPATMVTLWGLALTPAIHRAVHDLTWAEAGASAFAVGLAAATASVRWVSAPPPNYSMPLVPSPAGAIPPSLVSGMLRGVDVLLVATVPILLLSPTNGAQVSIMLSVAMGAIIVGRAPARARTSP